MRYVPFYAILISWILGFTFGGNFKFPIDFLSMPLNTGLVLTGFTSGLMFFGVGSLPLVFNRGMEDFFFLNNLDLNDPFTFALYAFFRLLLTLGLINACSGGFLLSTNVIKELFGSGKDDELMEWAIHLSISSFAIVIAVSLMQSWLKNF
ncbi:MAG: hypothetical protein ACE5K4_01450 [Candidatus Hydrothermarchaeota archaeon]